MSDQPPPLSMIFGLPPQEAIDFLRQKGYRIGFDYRDVWRQEHQAAFTVAKAMSVDLLRDIRGEIDKALAEGTTLETFRQALEPNLVRRGWWGRKPMTDPLTGEIRDVQLGSPRRLKVIYDTNLRTAHAEGQWERIQAVKEFLPYLMYDHTPGKHERPEHVAWDGLVLPADDPWWKTHYPIKAYGCKCGVIQLGERQLERLGKKVDKAPEESMRTYVNERAGAVQRLPAGVDPSFDYPPGGRLAHLSKMLEQKLDALPDDLATAAKQVFDQPALPPVVSAYVGAVGKEFMKSMREGLATVPEAARREVNRAGYSVMGGRSLTEIAPRLKTAPPPRGYPPGATWENVDGVTLHKEKIIAIASTVKLADGTIEATSVARVGTLLRHEHGHALDRVIGASDSPAFAAAHAADTAALTPELSKLERISVHAEDKLRYLLRSRSEAFAELFAELSGGGTAQLIDAAKAMPRSREVVRAIMNDLDEKSVR